MSAQQGGAHWLSPYITFQDQSRFYIAQTNFPNYLGEVLRGSGLSELEQCIAWAQVPGYRVYVRFAGVLQMGGLPLEIGWRDRAGLAVMAMATWYGVARVAPQEKKWEEWRVREPAG